MSSQKTLALTLRALDFSETSQIVTVFTRDFGRMSLLAKGSRRKRRGIQSGIDVFQTIEIVYIEKHGALSLLTEYALREDFAGLRRRLDCGYAAFFVAELLVKMTEEHDPAPEVFDLACETLDLLCRTDRPTVVLHAFEVKLLGLIGLVPRFDGCAQCGGPLPPPPRLRRTDATADGSGEVAFAPGSGGALCPSCAPSTADRLTVSRGALAMLARLASTPSNRVERLRISGTIAQDIRKVLARVWLDILGREPEMVKYLDWTPRSGS